MSILTLARLQFAFTAAFHYLYPPLSIGLGLLLVIVEGLWLATKKPLYPQMARFWTKVFALTFAIGVATVIAISRRKKPQDRRDRANRIRKTTLSLKSGPDKHEER